MLTLIYQLLLLDKKDGSPQVYIFDLEEVNHFVSITYRFDQEDKDVHIPFRSPSNTLVKGDLKNFLRMKEEMLEIKSTMLVNFSQD